MTAADLPAALRLWRKTEGVGLNESDRLPPLRRFLRRNPGLSQVARTHRRLLGAVLCGHEGRRGYLHHLAGAADCRNQGIGRKLTEIALARLKTLGIAKCNLFLYQNNRRGRIFWERLGAKAREDLVVVQFTLGQPGARRTSRPRTRPPEK